VLVNSQKVNCRRWTAGLVLLAVLALSSCGKKSDESTASNSSSQPAGQSSAPAGSTTASTTASKEPTATATSKSTTSKSSSSNTSKSSSSKSSALSAEAQKLGVKPNGTDCPTNAPIKGNLSKKGNQIYHDTKEASYKTVKPEICFADVATAQKAGFRAPKAAK
jgi:hypothetical protein